MHVMAAERVPELSNKRGGGRGCNSHASLVEMIVHLSSSLSMNE